MMDRMVALGRELARMWLHASLSRTAWSLPLPVVLVLAALVAVWLMWVGP